MLQRVFTILAVFVQTVHNVHLAFVHPARQVQTLPSIAMYRTDTNAAQTLNVSQIHALQQVHPRYCIANLIPLAKHVVTLMYVMLNYSKLAQTDIANTLKDL